MRAIEVLFNTKQQINPFSFLLIIKIQEGLLSAQCPMHIVSSSLHYKSNYRRIDGDTFLTFPAASASPGATP